MLNHFIDIRKTLFVNIENNLVKIIFLLADLFELFIEKEILESMKRRAQQRGRKIERIFLLREG